jgi:hypothetical protein
LSIPNNNLVCRPKARRSRSRAIKNKKLMFYEQRFSNYGPSTARSEQVGDRYEKVDEKYSENTHHRIIITKTSCMTKL